MSLIFCSVVPLEYLGERIRRCVITGAKAVSSDASGERDGVPLPVLGLAPEMGPVVQLDKGDHAVLVPIEDTEIGALGVKQRSDLPQGTATELSAVGDERRERELRTDAVFGPKRDVQLRNSRRSDSVIIGLARTWLRMPR